MLPLIRMTMVTTIYFDVQPRLFAKEVEIVNAGRMLPAEFVAAEPAVTQPAPHEIFRPGFHLAKLAGALSVGHVGNLSRAKQAARLVLTLALTCFLSPQGEEHMQARSGGSVAVEPIPARVFPPRRFNF